jgi:hypothetical protein
MQGEPGRGVRRDEVVRLLFVVGAAGIFGDRFVSMNAPSLTGAEPS